MDTLIPQGRPWSFQNVEFLYPANTDGYVRPRFEHSENIKDCRYLVVAAPGAVGKSAFAQYLANTKRAMVWDLASLKLGSNTFIGSVVKAVGPQALSEFLASINGGETVLVFDALDEAELHSGWAGVESLLKEVVELTPKAKKCSVVFLARRDTAELIGMALEELVGSVAEVASTAIGFFDRSGAIDFILEQIKRIRGENFVSKLETVYRQKAAEAISIGVDGTSAAQQKAQWSDHQEERFFGYAPVLQTLAAVLAQADNPHKLKFDQAPGEHSEIIAKIIATIIERENQKFSNALANRDIRNRTIVDGFGIYSTEDQLSRLLSYVIGDRQGAFHMPGGLDTADSAILDDMVRSFLPQHPFLNGKTFAGPAFRDYLIAWGLLHKDFRRLAEAFVDSHQPLYTQILAGIYSLLGNSHAISDDVEILYESASSGAPKGERGLFLFISEDGSNLNIEIVGGVNAGQTVLEFISPAPEEVRFRHRLNNAHVLLPNAHVRLGRPEMEFEVTGSEVLAERLIIDADFLRARSTEGRASRLQAAEAVWAPALRVEAEKKSLEVRWPKSKSFPWTDYSANFSLMDEESGAAGLLHVVGRILTWFRKDRRDEYGRYADLIRNIVVGQSAAANLALEFLFEIGAVYEKGNLLLLNPQVLDGLGIRWSVTRGDSPAPAALAAAEKFLKQKNT